MKHMGRDERNRIKFSLGCRMSVADIAKALGRSQSTISRELLNRTISPLAHRQTTKAFSITLKQLYQQRITRVS